MMNHLNVRATLYSRIHTTPTFSPDFIPQTFYPICVPPSSICFDINTFPLPLFVVPLYPTTHSLFILYHVVHDILYLCSHGNNIEFKSGWWL